MRKRDPLTPEAERELEAIDRALAGEPVGADLRELEALVADVRATAPAMSPAFAARLEHDVREGFPAAGGAAAGGGRVRGRVPRGRWLLLPAAGSLAAVLVALVVVLGGSGQRVAPDRGAADDVTAPSLAAPESQERALPGAPRNADRAAAPPAAAGGGTASAPQPSAAAGAVPGPRKVQLSASLAIETAAGDFDAADRRVGTIVSDAGGIVAGARTSMSGGRSEGSYDLRIPSAKLDRTLAALAKLGRVTERDRSLTDITATFDSVQKRLTEARAERRGLLRTLERATTQAQIDSTKARLRSVGGRIADLERRRASLRRSADLAAVDLTIVASAEEGGASGGPWTPGDAARDALRVLEVLAGLALVALAVLVPLSLLGALLAFGVRLGRRRRRETALDPA